MQLDLNEMWINLQTAITRSQKSRKKDWQTLNEMLSKTADIRIGLEIIQIGLHMIKEYMLLVFFSLAISARKMKAHTFSLFHQICRINHLSHLKQL